MKRFVSANRKAAILTSIFLTSWLRPKSPMQMPFTRVMVSWQRMQSLPRSVMIMDIKFIGPTPDMINSMGDKITAKETMIKAGVPVVPVAKDYCKVG